MDGLKNYTATIAVGLLSIHCSFSESFANPEKDVLNGVAQAMQVYSFAHDDKTPESWKQIHNVLDLDKLAQRSIRKPFSYIEDRYEFIKQPMAYRAEGSHVVLVRTLPFQAENERLKRRIAIVRNTSGQFVALYVNEPMIQRMVEESGVIITPKLELPVEEQEVQYQRPAMTPQVAQQTTSPSPAVEIPTSTAAKSMKIVPTKQLPVALIVGGAALLAALIAALVMKRRKR